MPYDLADLRFVVLRNAIYHASRRRFLDTGNRALTFVVIAAGAGAVGDIGQSLGVTAQWLAAIATLAGALQLVFDLAGKARTHEFLQRRFYEVLAEIDEAGQPTEAQIAKWNAGLARLYAEEPPPMRALEAISHNAAKESLGAGRRVRVEWWHTLLKQWWPFHGSEFPYTTDRTSKPLQS